MKKIVISSIKSYKKYLSPILQILFGHSCRFTPSCSQYTMEAVEKKGIIKGLLMGMVRIIRCNPLSKPKYDPVI